MLLVFSGKKILAGVKGQRCNSGHSSMGSIEEKALEYRRVQGGSEIRS
jgi:hypothetical protein